MKKSYSSKPYNQFAVKVSSFGNQPPKNLFPTRFTTTYQASYCPPSNFKKPDPLLNSKKQEKMPTNFNSYFNSPPIFSYPNNNINSYHSQFEPFTPVTPMNYVLPHTDRANWSEISAILNEINFNKPPHDSTLRAIEHIMLKVHKHVPDLSLLKSCIQFSEKPSQEVLEFIAELVIKTPQFFNNSSSIPFLTSCSKDVVTVTRGQCACLLANMFMGTTRLQNLPDLPRRFNFMELFSSTRDLQKDQVKYEKINCILNYFKTIMYSQETLHEPVTFQRFHLDNKSHGTSDLESWMNCKEKLQEVKVDEKHKIEGHKNMIEVDFANKFLGGGTLGAGAAQEEIQFITRPEQIVGLLFCSQMKENEAIRIKGAKMYSGYQGYSNTFTMMPRDHDDSNQEREVIAIDAQDFQRIPYESQFEEFNILREVNKAYIGFYGDPSEISGHQRKALSTGPWGCGVFKGDEQLKFLLQWIAASRAGRKMVYHCSDLAKKRELECVIQNHTGKSVGDLMRDVLNISQRMRSSHKRESRIFTLLNISSKI